MKLKNIFLILLMIFSFSKIQSQDIMSLEKIIKALEKNLAETKNDMDKTAIADELEATFEQYLSNPESFESNLNLKHISILKSEDNKLKVITWNVPFSNGSNSYYGFLQYKSGKNKIKLTNLKDIYRNIQSPEMTTLRKLGWRPILYYKIITSQDRKKTYYTLLGWDGKDAISNIKIIDILKFNMFKKPQWGDKILLANGRKYGHIEFEYNRRSVMNLKNYNGNIVFDHLEPLEPQYQGNKQYYGPDGTYDGFIFENGKWIYVSQIDVRNPKNERGKKRTKRKNY